jgi:hypothetical protein
MTIEDYNDTSVSIKTIVSTSVTPLVPMVWHIPKSAGTFLKRYLACLNVTIACELGKHIYDQNHGPPIAENHQPSLDELPLSGFGYYVNVDVSTKTGIKEAHDLGFATKLRSQKEASIAGLASATVDLAIVTTFVHTAAQWLFEDPLTNLPDGSINTTEIPRGVLLTVMRDPIARQASLFHYLQYAKHEPTYHPEWKNLTIMEWEGGEDNWMARVLSGVLESEKPMRKLTDEDFHKAKGRLQNFCVVSYVVQETNSQF